MPYPGQDLLVGAILCYRRFLSGRGPLRSVVCTFCRSESCSAYGLRVAREAAASLPEALRLIRGRLRRCRQAALYRFPDGWGWGECHDERDPAALEGKLERAHELPVTLAAVLWSAALVARHRGDERLVRAFTLRAGRHGGQAGYVVVRDGRKLRRSLRQRLCVRLGLAGVLLAAACALPVPLSFMGMATLAVAGVAEWQEYRRQRGRFELQAVANGFGVGGLPIRGAGAAAATSRPAP